MPAEPAPVTNPAVVRITKISTHLPAPPPRRRRAREAPEKPLLGPWSLIGQDADGKEQAYVTFGDLDDLRAWAPSDRLAGPWLAAYERHATGAYVDVLLRHDPGLRQALEAGPPEGHPLHEEYLEHLAQIVTGMAPPHDEWWPSFAARWQALEPPPSPPPSPPLTEEELRKRPRYRGGRKSSK